MQWAGVWCHTQHAGGPTFNGCLSAGTDPRSILHIILWLVPGFSGGVKVFCYTGPGVPCYNDKHQ